MATSAGMPICRAMIAACEVAPPRDITRRHHALTIKRREIGRREFHRRQHGFSRQIARGRVGQAEHALFDIVQIGGAFRQQLVVNVVQERDLRADCFAPGEARALAEADQIARGVDQRRIFEQHAMHHENARFADRVKL